MLAGRGGGGAEPHPHSSLRALAYNPDNRDAARLTNFQGWRTGFYSPRLNGMIEQALLEPDPGAQQRAYQAIQRVYEDEVGPILPISQMVETVVYRNTVSDLIDYVSGPGPCANGLGDWAGCYANTARARFSGVTLQAARRVGEFNLSASLDLQNPRNLDTGKRLVRRAQRHASLNADTRSGEWLWGAEWKLSGQRYNDVANTQSLGGYGLVHLFASRPLGNDWSLLLRVDNVGDKGYATVRGYATAGRSFYAGLKWAPK